MQSLSPFIRKREGVVKSLANTFTDESQIMFKNGRLYIGKAVATHIWAQLVYQAVEVPVGQAVVDIRNSISLRPSDRGEEHDFT